MGTEKTDDTFDPFSPVDFTVVPTETAKDLEEFDPFQIGSLPVKSKKVSPQTSPEGKAKESETAGTATSRASTALPPRLDVKFKIHEEVSSVADPNQESEGASDIVVDGTVLVRLSKDQFLLKNDQIVSLRYPLKNSSCSGAGYVVGCTQKFSLHPRRQ